MLRRPMDVPTPEPFPYEQWPRVTRSAVSEIGHSARAIPSWVRSRAIQEASSLLGVPCSAELSPATVTPSNPLVAVTFESDDGSRAAVAVDITVATHAIERLLGSGAEKLPLTAPPLGPVQEGALIYLAARLLPERCGWYVRAIHQRANEVTEWLNESGLSLAGQVRIGSETSWMRAWVRLAPGHRPSALPSPSPALPIPMVLEAGWGRLPIRELADLRGDVVVLPDESWLDDATPLRGEVRLRASGGARNAWRCRIDMSRVVVAAEEQCVLDDRPARGRTVPTPLTDSGLEASKMNDGQKSSETVDRGDHLASTLNRVGDAEVEIIIELARFTMRLDELAGLSAGAVVATGREIGDLATLRAAGRPIATGELVSIDGEIGLRIHELSEE